MVTVTVLAGLVLGALIWYRTGVNPPPPPLPKDTPGRMRDAQASIGRKDYARAETDYRVVRQSEPDNADALAGLVRVLGLQDKKEKKDQIPPLLLQAAKMRVDAKDYQGAADLYRQVLRIDNGNAEAHKGLDTALALLSPPQKRVGPPPPPKLKFALHLYSRDTEISNGQEFNILDDKLGGLAQNELKFMLTANRPLPNSNKYIRLRWLRKTPEGKTDQIADREMTTDALGTVQPLLSRPRAGEQEIWFEWNGEEVADFKFTITPAQ
jgi:tetratricopeptide (TPR) repeat protein